MAVSTGVVISEKYRRADSRRNIKRAISVDSRAKLVAVLHT
jgi:hypothetical protein